MICMKKPLLLKNLNIVADKICIQFYGQIIEFNAEQRGT